MIYKEDCFVGACDNCQEIFTDGDYSMFPLESDLKDEMQNSEWYADGTDPDHKGKHYCPDCFKYHPEEDDKIMVDLSRKKEPDPLPALPSVQGVEELVAAIYKKRFIEEDTTDGYIISGNCEITLQEEIKAAIEEAFIAGSQSQVDVSGLIDALKKIEGGAEPSTEREAFSWKVTAKNIAHDALSNYQSNSPVKGEDQELLWEDIKKKFFLTNMLNPEWKYEFKQQYTIIKK